MKKRHIPITRPCFNHKEIRALGKVIKSCWLTQGEQVEVFEKAFSDYAGTGHAVAVSSCTSALHLCLIASGVGRSDEVIVPAFTFIATANAVEYTGAKPIFSDIDLNTFNIDVSQIEKKITSRTRAIIPVHLFGLSCDMKALLKVANKYNLTVIEDAACAIGSTVDGKMAGTFGKFGCFSFHPRKVMVTGEGGMIVFNNRSYKKQLLSLRSHGASSSDLESHRRKVCSMPDFDTLGYNYRMTEMQAAVGIEQLRKVEFFIKKRIILAERYNKALEKAGCFIVPHTINNYRHTYQTYVVLLPKNHVINRDRLMLKLARLGIMTKIGTHALHLQGYYRRKYSFIPQDFPNAFAAQRQTLALPLYPQMSFREQEYVIDCVIKSLER